MNPVTTKINNGLPLLFKTIVATLSYLIFIIIPLSFFLIFPISNNEDLGNATLMLFIIWFIPPYNVIIAILFVLSSLASHEIMKRIDTSYKADDLQSQKKGIKEHILPLFLGLVNSIIVLISLFIISSLPITTKETEQEITRLEKEITEFQNSKVELKKENIHYVTTTDNEGDACKNVQGLDLSDDSDSCMLIGITLQFPQKENVTGVWKYIQKYDQYVKKDPVIDNNRREPVIDAEFVIEGQVVPKQNISIIYDSRDYSSLESTGVLEIYFTVITQNIVGTEVPSYMRVLCGHALKKPMAIRFTYFPSPASYVNLDDYTTSMDIALPEGIFADIYKYTYPGYMPAECAPADWTP